MYHEMFHAERPFYLGLPPTSNRLWHSPLMIESELTTDNGPRTTDKRSRRTGQKLSSESGIGIFQWELVGRPVSFLGIEIHGLTVAWIWSPWASSMTVTSGGERNRMGGPQVPVPRLTYIKV